MILRWTLKSMLKARLRVLGSTLAVAAAFLLVTTFKAVWQGETEQLVAYIDHTDADVWVMQPHVSNMHMATSFISEGKRLQIADVEGVDAMGAILYLNTFVKAGQKSWFCYVVGVDEETKLGGPWSVPRGKHVPARGEAIVPEVLARISGLGLGDKIQIADKTFEIAGLSAETFSVGNPITFVHAADLSGLLSLVGYDSYVLVRAKPDVSAEVLAARIEKQVDDVHALPTSTFVANDRTLAKQMGAEVIGLLTGICAALAAVLVGFSLYIHTARQRRELAILKALGFRNRHVYASVLLQSLLLTGTAFAIAALAAQGLVFIAPKIAPILSLSLTARSLLEIGLTGLAVALGSTLVLARRVTRVDPLSVFHT